MRLALKLLLGTILALVVGAALSSAIGWGISTIPATGILAQWERMRGTIVPALALLGAFACASAFLLRVPFTLTRILCPLASTLVLVAFFTLRTHPTPLNFFIVLAGALVALLPAAFMGWYLSRRLAPISLPAWTVTGDPGNGRGG